MWNLRNRPLGAARGGSMSGVVRCPLPSCGGVMVKRTNRATGSEFLGCDQYPICVETMEIPESVILRAAGAPELPLFDELPPDPGRG